MNKDTATLVSRLFDPLLVFIFLLLFALHKSTLTGPAQLRFLAVTIITMAGIPAGLLFLAIRKKIVSNWDMSIRSERPRVLIPLLILETIILFLLRNFMDPFLFGVLVFIFVVMSGFTVITLFWKISGHACVNALATGLMVLWFGWEWWPVLLIVPLVGWARVVRKDHTPAQVVAGALYPWMLLFIRNSIS